MFSYIPTYRVIIGNFILTWVSLPIILIMTGFYKKKKRKKEEFLHLEFFCQSFTTDNIYMRLKTIFEKYKNDNKFFAIGFDNASNNTTAIHHLINLCNPYFGLIFFIKYVLLMF